MEIPFISCVTIWSVFQNPVTFMININGLGDLYVVINGPPRPLMPGPFICGDTVQIGQIIFI